MNKSVGILGCGWLGTVLGEQLLLDGYSSVKGSTTSSQKIDSLTLMGIDAYMIRLGENAIEGDINGFLEDVDVLIINVPPNLRKKPKSNYVKKMGVLLDAIKDNGVSFVVFVSSTSVYGAIDGEITEEIIPNPKTNSGKQLLASEQLFLREHSISTAIIRFGGLIGEDRHPVFHLSQKELGNGEELINLIHRNDCIHMIRTIMENGYWNEIFNGVYPHHPTKAEYYVSEAKKRGVPPPIYLPSTSTVSKKKIVFRNFYVKKHVLTTSISS
ncbi:MAG: SDR family NAD(P)-dependent oxidoreductase [Bacteroidota bacterium]